MENKKKKENGEGTRYIGSNGRDIFEITINYKTYKLYQRKRETSKEFTKRINELKTSLDNGTYIQKNKQTLKEILQNYIEQKFKDGTTSPRSYKRELETLAQLQKTCNNFIDKPIQKITIEMIEDCKSNMRIYSKNCIDKQWTLLKIGFKLAYSRKKISFNIMDDITLKKPISNKKQEKKEALTIEEEQKLRNILNNEEKDHKYRDIVMFQLEHGMRIGENLARSINDIDLKENTIHIWNTLTQDENGKTIIGQHTKIYDKKTQIDKGERTIPLTLEGIKIVNKIIQSNIRNMHNLLFWDYENNSFISYQEINSWLDRLNTKYHITDKSLSSHILRHSKITRMQEAGVALPVIQYMVGHVEGSNITNEVYTSVSLDFVNNEMKKVN